MSFVRPQKNMDENGQRRRNQQRQRPRPHVYNGYVPSPLIYNQIVSDVKTQLQSRIFCSVWSYIAQFIGAVIWSKASTISDGICYFAAAMLLLYLFIYCNDYLKRAWTWKDLKRTNPLIWILIAVLFAMVFDIYGHLDILYAGLDEVRSGVKRLDAQVIKIRQDLDTRFYKPAIADDSWWKPVDDRIVFVLGKLGISRASLGWGCFEQGTLIQIDELGHEVAIEELVYGDYEYVYNGAMRVPFSFVSVGNETGYLYEVTTMDSFAVNVTATHAMRMCAVTGDDDVEESVRGGALLLLCEDNVAAQDVQVGNWTVTRNGYQQIQSIRKYAVRDVPVYNIWLDMPENAPLSSRVVIANGIETFDLRRQKENH